MRKSSFDIIRILKRTFYGLEYEKIFGLLVIGILVALSIYFILNNYKIKKRIYAFIYFFLLNIHVYLYLTLPRKILSNNFLGIIIKLKPRYIPFVMIKRNDTIFISLFLTVLFLALFALSNDKKSICKIKKSKAVNIFGRYGIIHLFFLSALFLYIYLIHSAIVSNLNTVSVYFVLLFLIFGFVTLVFNKRIVEDSNYKIVRMFNLYYIMIITPLIILAISIITNTLICYGVTERRYFSILILFVMIFSNIYILAIKNFKLKYIYLSLTLIPVFTVYGPINYLNISFISQKYLLKRRLTELNILQDGIIYKYENGFDHFHEKKQISSIITFFNQRKLLRQVNFFKNTIDIGEKKYDEANNPFYRYEIGNNGKTDLKFGSRYFVWKYLGFNYTGLHHRYFPNRGQYVNFINDHSNFNELFLKEKYDYYFFFDEILYQNARNKSKFDRKDHQIVLDHVVKNIDSLSISVVTTNDTFIVNMHKDLVKIVNKYFVPKECIEVNSQNMLFKNHNKNIEYTIIYERIPFVTESLRKNKKGTIQIIDYTRRKIKPIRFPTFKIYYTLKE